MDVRCLQEYRKVSFRYHAVKSRRFLFYDDVKCNTLHSSESYTSNTDGQQKIFKAQPLTYKSHCENTPLDMWSRYSITRGPPSGTGWSALHSRRAWLHTQGVGFGSE